ncbi:MAG: DUF3553 domain-containing protein [Tistrella sp.]|jgi:hypothetical protein|uniref:DUF3553 domain-containing protein n=3 Tax=Tistrella mobilis TaxID=171437 RepID=I3TJX2_TISMK|nr:DUF3553 domain-containing protein [Tistrella sp.]AFK53060.1 hypothetical protein TMO_1221 [Tistrella mobilis KA081020-065]KYO54027.1 hypothetical protein AUP44_25765 [Tistrella mobilis]MAD40099.1 DUF3553 domain-containing protein [Tistrella sp.]MAM75937.1 DUF3553 domain-containing protein [Tistrella sp.]MBA77286.1 DUF3553 domain-containing protein [Tistrella sp.]
MTTPAPYGMLYPPGSLVRLPGQPDWGLGQVQSVAAHRVTVNFEHGGKRTVHADVVDLELVRGPNPPDDDD